MYFLGIDAGQSHIEVVLYHNDQMIFTGRGGPSHVQGQDMEQVFTQSLTEAIISLPYSEKIVAIGAGISGLGISGKREAVRRSIEKHFPNAYIYLENDAIIGHWGGSLGNSGASVIAGTGSIACGKFHDHSFKTRGGFGYLFDESGGSWIGLQTIRRALLSAEGRDQPTEIVNIVADHYNVSSISKVPGIIYAKSSVDVEMIAGLAKNVILAATKGDTVAYEIVKEAGKNIGYLTVSLLKDLSVPAAEPFPIHKIGGIWKTDSAFVEASDQIVRKEYPNAIWKLPQLGPAEGAAIMAMGKYKKRSGNDNNLKKD